MIEYTARFGTVFKGPKDLDSLLIIRAKNYVDENKPLSDIYFASDCLEFAGWHGVTVHPELNGFRGYDSIHIELSEIY